jgi:glycosyltransferase involved in cell wall biosynthesis
MARALRDAAVPTKKIELIPNGIELESASRDCNRAALKLEILGNAETRVVLYVGRLVKEKGLDRLLRVWASVPDRDGVVLVIVGDGPLKTDLESQARAPGSSVRFLGYRGDVSTLYAIADLFVLASVTEGLSNSLLEAMAAGVPVVASNVGGNRDVIEDQRSGFLVNWDDTGMCVEVLSRLLRDAGLRERIGNAGRKAVRRFSIGDVAARYRRVYGAVLEE